MQKNDNKVNLYYEDHTWKPPFDFQQNAKKTKYSFIFENKFLYLPHLTLIFY